MVDIEYETLLDDYADNILDGMDMDTVMSLAFDLVRANLGNMDKTEVMEEIQNNAPYLLGE